MVKGFYRVTVFIFIAITAANSHAQVGAKISCSSGWWATCCRCANCMQVDPPPAYGYCRHCNLLCSSCRKILGDLDAAIEKLKEKNRSLKEAYDAFEAQYSKALAEYVENCEKMYGEEGSGTLSGLNSALGKFSGALFSVVTNATRVKTPLKAVAAGLGYYQSSSGSDAALNTFGVALDAAGTDWGFKIFSQHATDAAVNKLMNDLAKGVPIDKALDNFLANVDCFPDTPVKLKDYANAAEYAGLAVDLYGFYYATQDIWDILGGLSENSEDMDDATKQMSGISDSITKNANLIACIRETQDSLNSGGIGFMAGKLENLYAGYFPGEPVMQLDMAKIQMARNQAGELVSRLKTTIKRFEKDVFSSLLPWIAGKEKGLKNQTAIQLLKRVQKAIPLIEADLTVIKNRGASVEYLVRNAITGFEIDYASTPGKDFQQSHAQSSIKWLYTDNPKLKAGMGRFAFDFPKGIEWNASIYTPQNKFITSRSSVGSQKFHDLDEGIYNIVLNHVKLENIKLEAGKNLSLRTGVLRIVNKLEWELVSDKGKFITSGNKPTKMAMFPGSYILKLNGKEYPVTISESMIVKFELPNPYLQVD